MTQRLLAVTGLAAVVLTGAHMVPASGQVAALPPQLTKTIAYYSTLTSYADSGTVVVEAPGMVDTAKTVTYFRRPTRDLYVELHAVNSVSTSTKFTIDMSATRVVIWMFKGEMATYNASAGQHDLIDAGAQVRTLQNAAHGTKGISTLIPALLYSQSRLPGTISQIEQAMVAGIEEVDRRRCHKVTGVAAEYYPSGQRTNVRPVTVWIDAETQLIRKVFDTPKGYPARSYQRKTTTLQPQANPAIDDGKFQFTVPE